MRTVALLLVVAQSLAGAAWIRLTSPHFELYTDGSEASGRNTIQGFEQLRSFYAQIPEYRQRNLLPARIVEFASLESFNPYRSAGLEAGHYESNGDRDWIALGPMSSSEGRSRLIAHEYNHLIVARAGLRLPAWLTEGLAEVFSTAGPAGERTSVGGIGTQDLPVLKSRTWGNLDSLVAMDAKAFAAMMNGSKEESVHMFYSDCRGLAHMLYLAPGYSEHFPKFLSGLNQGKTTAEALRTAFGRESGEVARDLRAYWQQQQQPVRLFSEKMTMTPVSVTLRPVADFESSLVQSDLLAVMGKRSETVAAFNKLELSQAVAAQIRSAPAEQSIAIASMYIHLAREIWNPEQPNGPLLAMLEKVAQLPQIPVGHTELAAAEAELHYFLGVFEIVAKQPIAKIIEPLIQALRLKPDLSEATLRLAETYRAGRDYTSSADSLLRALKVTPDDTRFRVLLGNIYTDAKDYPAALAAFSEIPADSGAAGYASSGVNAVADAYVATNHFEDALRAVESGRKWATDGSAYLDHVVVGIWHKSAYASLLSGDFKHARASLETAARLVPEPADMQENERLKGLTEARSNGPLATRPGEKMLRAEGMVQALECPAAGPLLRLLVDGKQMRFNLPDPAAVEMTGTSDASIDLHCGELKPVRVVIEYAPSSLPLSKTSSGIVRKMGF